MLQKRRLLRMMKKMPLTVIIKKLQKNNRKRDFGGQLPNTETVDADTELDHKIRKIT